MYATQLDKRGKYYFKSENLNLDPFLLYCFFRSDLFSISRLYSLTSIDVEYIFTYWNYSGWEKTTSIWLEISDFLLYFYGQRGEAALPEPLSVINSVRIVYMHCPIWSPQLYHTDEKTEAEWAQVIFPNDYKVAEVSKQSLPTKKSEAFFPIIYRCLCHAWFTGIVRVYE